MLGTCRASSKGGSKPLKAVTEHGRRPLAKVPSGVVLLVVWTTVWSKVMAQTPCHAQGDFFITISAYDGLPSWALVVVKHQTE